MPPSLLEALTAPFGPETPPPPPIPVPEGPGRRLGGYELCYQLATGGMATIYLARKLTADGYGRPVAIKRLHPHHAGFEDMEAMLVDEARIASRIAHPNVCAVLEIGQADGGPFIAMEYLAGVPLSRLSRAVSRRKAVLASTRWHALAARVVSDAAAGLHAAHELTEGNVPLDVVHRDVSPSNVFVGFDGNVKVLDFGVAAARKRLRVTRELEIKGKLAYIAPEQARGERVDRRADIWGLGLCLWEALAGRRLFSKTSVVEHLVQDRLEPLPGPSEVVPAVPRALDKVVERALRWDREDRYPTARHMAADLFRFVRSSGEAAGSQQLASLLLELFRVVHSREKDVLMTVTGDSTAPTQGSTVTLPSRPGLLAPDETGRDETETVQLPPPSVSGTNWLELFEGAGDQTDTTPASGERAPAFRPMPPFRRTKR